MGYLIRGHVALPLLSGHVPGLAQAVPQLGLLAGQAVDEQIYRALGQQWS